MWTLDELVDRVGQALAAEYSGAPNGRVRDVPDRRAIRWYKTIGLIDRPLGMSGRTALYGPRHLLQLVAIKRRQADGLTIAQIQAELTGADDAVLAEVARVPAELLFSEGPHPGVTPIGRARFWAAPAVGADEPEAPADLAMRPVTVDFSAPPPTFEDRPRPPSGAAPTAPVPASPAPAAGGRAGADARTGADARAGGAAPSAPGGTADRADGRAAAPGWDPSDDVMVDAAVASVRGRLAGVAPVGDSVIGAVRLGGGAVLVLPGVPDSADRAAISAAAAPLLAVLADRGLLEITEDGMPS